VRPTLKKRQASQKDMRKRLIIGGSLLLAAVFVVVNGAVITPLIDPITRPITFYLRVARLYTKEPDQKLSMPVKGVTKDQITNTWHAPRGADRKHEGQDIFAPRGTPIFSATNGYVLRVGENTLGGRTVSVIGSGGRVYYYAHLESYADLLSEGDEVTPRTVLGYVGTTGNAQGTPPHLHFGVYAPTGAVNPLPLLVDRTSPPIPSVSDTRR
jgi:peptidoglycan LD-endopeptidase LytH